MNIYE